MEGRGGGQQLGFWRAGGMKGVKEVGGVIDGALGRRVEVVWKKGSTGSGLERVRVDEAFGDDRQ